MPPINGLNLTPPGKGKHSTGVLFQILAVDLIYALIRLPGEGRTAPHPNFVVAQSRDSHKHGLHEPGSSRLPYSQDMDIQCLLIPPSANMRLP